MKINISFQDDFSKIEINSAGGFETIEDALNYMLRKVRKIKYATKKEEIKIEDDENGNNK